MTLSGFFLSFLSDRSVFTKKKTYTTTTERKSFGKLFWPQRQNFPGPWWIRKPYKNQENHVYHRNLSSVAPYFFGKVPSLEQGGVCFLGTPPTAFLRNSVRKRPESETGIGGVKTYRTPGGGGTRPESCPWKAWTFDPQYEGFL